MNFESRPSTTIQGQWDLHQVDGDTSTPLCLGIPTKRQCDKLASRMHAAMLRHQLDSNPDQTVKPPT